MPITLSAGEQRQLDVQLTPLPIEPARLSGYVTDASTGLPIGGATVHLIGPLAYTGVTDNEGVYDIVAIIPGSYSVEVSHPDYETATI